MDIGIYNGYDIKSLVQYVVDDELLRTSDDKIILVSGNTLRKRWSKLDWKLSYIQCRNR